jgi:DNA-binding NarL/FixJ family response regulator
LDTSNTDRERILHDETTQPITVVLGDANRLLTRTLTALLDAQPDFRVVRALADIDEVLNATVEMEPDIVLLGTDLLLEEFSRCVATFREGRPRSKLIIMSSYEDEELLEASVRAGAVGYLHGDLPFDQMIVAVRRVHEGDVLFAPHVLVGLLQRATRPADPPASSASTTLGPRELEVLQALARGMSTQQIADRLEISTHTVRSHVRNLMKKLRARTKLDAVMIGLRERLITLDR